MKRSIPHVVTRFGTMSARERLVHHVQELERLTAVKQAAAATLADAFAVAKSEGFDPTTLKVVLKLRQMTPHQRRERRALEAIYMGALGMLEGDPLPEEARRRLDGQNQSPPPPPPDASGPQEETPAPAKPPDQPTLALKDPEEARREGGEAAASGRRIYDNPYPAGDPCRAAWDEGWCAHSQSHGMDMPAAYQRRTEKPPDRGDKKDDQSERGAA